MEENLELLEFDLFVCADFDVDLTDGSDSLLSYILYDYPYISV
jgi:hypothetical protein